MLSEEFFHFTLSPLTWLILDRWRTQNLPVDKKMGSMNFDSKHVSSEVSVQYFHLYKPSPNP